MYRGLRNVCNCGNGMCITCAVPIFTNYFFYDRLVTSFKRVIKDKELLFIAHKIVAACVKHSTCDTQGALQLQTFHNRLYSTRDPCAPRTTDCGNKDSNHSI